MQKLNLPNYLVLPITLLDESNLDIQLKQRFIKQLIISQVIYVYNVWRGLSDHHQQLKVGIIGCGVIGKLIINSLLPYTKKQSQQPLNAWQIHISTRRPDTLNDFSQCGVQIYFDNDRLIKECNFIIIAIPPTLDHWSLLELKDSLQARFQSPNKPFVLSLISNLTEDRISSLLKTNCYVHRTNICLKLLQKGVEQYKGIVQNQLTLKNEKIFQTEVDEDIAKHLQKESYLHFIDDQRITSLLRCLGQCLGMDQVTSIDQYYKNENISKAMLGRTPQEFASDLKIMQQERQIFIENLIKIGFDKRFFEYQSQVKQN